jgi:translocation and assembly module TamB
LEVTPQAIQISELDSIVGGGTVSLMGDVHLTGLEATGYDLSMRLEDGRIQLLDWLPPVLGSGDFRINGPTSYPMISGDVEVNAMNFTERIDWEGALLSFAPEALVGASSDEEGYFQYDINMVANNSIRIRNNLADVYASADLKFIGDLATPGMMGTVTLAEQGRALFKERDFSIQKGLLRYEDPYSFDPILDIALKTTVSTPERDVDINYFVTGLYSDWQTHTTSSPSLPQADINALLLFGMTRRDLEADGGLGTALAIEGSDLFVSQFGIVQRFNEAGDGLFLNSEILHLDRIDIISGPTDRNSAYVSSALRLLAEKDIGDGTLRLEQNITDATDVFVSWEQKMTERLYTRLYWSSQQQGRAINGTGALGAEFEVQWELD